jgi:aspartyl protease family protein
MDPESQADKQVSSMGAWMFGLAWVVIFVALIAYFSGFLDRKVNPNQSPSSVVTQAGVEVRLKQNAMGHYVTSGLINGRQVVFLLDTGATSVSVGAHLAQELSLIPRGQQMVQTANGNLMVATTTIDELKIGDITLQNVEANLNPGMRSDKILLGMSALRHLEWSQRGDMLTLRTF